MTATAYTTGWMIDLPGRDPMPMRILAAGGDSVVSEIGPNETGGRHGARGGARASAAMAAGR